MAANILVLHFETDETLTHDHYRQFFKEVDPDLSVTVVSLDELAFVIANDGVELFVGAQQTSIKEFTHLIARGSVDKYRDIVLPAVQVAEMFGLACWNATGGGFARSKLAQTIQMQQLGLPVPLTIFSMNRTLLEAGITANVGYPCIVKDWKGAHGNDNHLVRSSGDLKRVFDGSKEGISFVAQQFVPNDGDYRYLVVGNQSLLIHRSSADGSHLNNTSQGGEASLVGETELPDEIIQLSTAYAREYGMAIYGADIIRDNVTGNCYFLEFNSQPQLVTGAFLEQKRAMIRRALKSS